MSRKLTLDDIADLRAYERERDEFRRQVIDLKKRRRVHLGPFMTAVFENRDTIRFQIQEMARVERLMTDEAIEIELKTYNPLVPEPGQLALTLFIELTSEADLRRWLPELVGVERAVGLRIGEGDDRIEVAATPESGHAEALTREEITSSVHYLEFHLDDGQVDDGQIDAFERGPVELVVDHPAYRHAATLGDETVAELLTDLRA